MKINNTLLFQFLDPEAGGDPACALPPGARWFHYRLQARFFYRKDYVVMNTTQEILATYGRFGWWRRFAGRPALQAAYLRRRGVTTIIVEDTLFGPRSHRVRHWHPNGPDGCKGHGS